MEINDLAQYTSAHRTRQHGMENGYVEKTGKRVQKWRGYYHVYRTQADGTTKRIKQKKILGLVAKMTKGEAEEALRVLIRRVHELPAAESAGCTVGLLCDDALELKLGDWEEDTKLSNESVFKLIKKHLGGQPIGAVKAEELKRFLNRLAQQQRTTKSGKVRTGFSVSYFKKVIIYLRLIFDLAAERGLVSKNPARSITIKLRVPQIARSREDERLRGGKPILPPEELRRLLAVMDERDRLIVWTLIIGATRPNELLAVHGRDVGPNWILIEKSLTRNLKNKSTKTRRSRYVYIPPFLDRDLHRWVQEKNIGPDDLLFVSRFGGPLSRQVFLRDRLRPAAERAGISTLNVSSQMLRRSFATIADALDMDAKAIQAQMGHKYGSVVTDREYMQPVDAKRAAQMDLLGQMLNGEMPMPLDLTAKLGRPQSAAQVRP